LEWNAFFGGFSTLEERERRADFFGIPIQLRLPRITRSGREMWAVEYGTSLSLAPYLFYGGQILSEDSSDSF